MTGYWIQEHITFTGLIYFISILLTDFKIWWWWKVIWGQQRSTWVWKPWKHHSLKSKAWMNFILLYLYVHLCEYKNLFVFVEVKVQQIKFWKHWNNENANVRYDRRIWWLPYCYNSQLRKSTHLEKKKNMFVFTSKRVKVFSVFHLRGYQFRKLWTFAIVFQTFVSVPLNNILNKATI